MQGSVLLLGLLVSASSAMARVLTVGPGGNFDLPSQAIAAAEDGDTIEIDTAGDYTGDVARIARNRLTLRGVGEGRAKLDSQGRVADEKGIWHVTGDDITVERIAFIGARCADQNGAGIRAAGRNLTVRNCRFYDCQDSILNGAGEIVIEYCEFDRCGWDGPFMAHNLYVGEKVDRLVYRFNHSRRSRHGHLLKSRARENIIAYNWLTDEAEGTGSYGIDLPNGGWALIIGNVLHKGAKAGNRYLVTYGMEGVRYERNALYVVHNTFVNEQAGGLFIRGRGWPEDMPQVITNNIFAGDGVDVTNMRAARIEGNFVGDPGFANADVYDFRIVTGSPAIDCAVPQPPVNGVSLVPVYEFIPGSPVVPRVPRGRTLDAGAFEASERP